MKTKRFTIIAWLIIVLIAVFFLVRCTPQRRLAQLHNKHPELFTSVQDTIHHNDTIHVKLPSVQVDTFVKYEQLTDTITITKDGLTTTLWKKADTVFVSSKTDTVKINVPYSVKIPVTKYIVPPPKKRSWMLWCFLVLCIAVIIKVYK